MKGRFGSIIMTGFNFKVKMTFLLRNWEICVDTKFWHVSRKSVAKEKKFCAVRSMDLEGRSCAMVKYPADRRRGGLIRYFGYGLARVILFLEVVFIP